MPGFWRKGETASVRTRAMARNLHNELTVWFATNAFAHAEPEPPLAGCSSDFRILRGSGLQVDWG